MAQMLTLSDTNWSDVIYKIILKLLQRWYVSLSYVLALLTVFPDGEVGDLVCSGPFPLRIWILPVQTDPAMN